MANRFKVKKGIVSAFLTVLIIGLLILSGPANAINVSPVIGDIDKSFDSKKQFTFEIQVNDGEFLPIVETNVDFTANSETTSCKIGSDDKVQGDCAKFLSVVSKEITGLTPSSGYGYSYDYGYESNGGYGYEFNTFGYGYDTDSGYGYGSKGQITTNGNGKITYTLEADVTKLPSHINGNNVQLQIRVLGGSAGKTKTFIGSSTFKVTQTDLVQAALDDLDFADIQGENTNQDNVTTDLNLITVGKYDTKITWSSNDNTLVSKFEEKVK